MRTRPVVLCILDGVGWGRRAHGDAVWQARTPTLDRLMATCPWGLLAAHGTAVGMPSDGDMGNSEVGHNAMGAGRVFDQGAKLVQQAVRSGRIWRSPHWAEAVRRGRDGGTLHLLGLLSDGNVHSHVDHLRAMIDRAAQEGVRRLRVHVLTDGRDVAARSALTWLRPLEQALAAHDGDYAVATGGGRMHITMDRYQADWAMVARGWACHVRGEGRRFPTACAAVQALYDADPEVDDQWLPAFVVGDYPGMADGDAVLLFNFRGDRAIEISRAFDEGPAFDASGFDRGAHPADLFFAGMMEYDGDTHVPAHYLVSPPHIDRTVGWFLARAGRTALALSETQKFGHVTYFFHGNDSAVPAGEDQVEIPSDNLPFDQAPRMQAGPITDRAVQAIASGRYDHVRLNYANGDMVGHTGKLLPTVAAVEALDAELARLEAAVVAAGGVLLITADHGNADEMLKVDRKTGQLARDADGRPVPSSSHSLNPVPLVLVDPTQRWSLVGARADHGMVGGLAQLGATVLQLCGLPVPEDYLPSLVSPAAPTDPDHP